MGYLPDYPNAAAGEWRDADDLGASHSTAAVAAKKDSIAALVGVEDRGGQATAQQLRAEAAGLDKVVADRGPVAVIAAGEPQVGGGVAAGGGTVRERAGVALEPADGLREAATLRVHNQVDGPAAALTAAMVEELRAGDTQHRACAFRHSSDYSDARPNFVPTAASLTYGSTGPLAMQ